MRIEGTVHVNATQHQVWQFLMSPQHLSQCTPNLESWRAIPETNQIEIILLRQLGSNRHMRIPIEITWQDIMPIHAATVRFMTIIGKQMVAANGEMTLQAETEMKTTLNFSLGFEAENKILLQLVNNSAPKVVTQFFKCLKSTVEGYL